MYLCLFWGKVRTFVTGWNSEIYYSILCSHLRKWKLLLADKLNHLFLKDRNLQHLLQSSCPFHNPRLFLRIQKYNNWPRWKGDASTCVWNLHFWEIMHLNVKFAVKLFALGLIFYYKNRFFQFGTRRVFKWEASKNIDAITWRSLMYNIYALRHSNQGSQIVLRQLLRKRNSPRVYRQLTQHDIHIDDQCPV